MTVVWKPRGLVRAVNRASAARGLYNARLIHCGGECCVVRYLSKRGPVAVRWCVRDERYEVECTHIDDLRSKIGKRFQSYFAWPLKAKPIVVASTASSVMITSGCKSTVTLAGVQMRLYESDLHDHITSGCATPEFITSAVNQLALALYLMHVAGYAHNDVRLENVLVKTGGKGVALADFGCMAPIGHFIACNGGVSKVDNDTTAFATMVDKLRRVASAMSQVISAGS